MQGDWLELSPARYQLLESVANMGYETYIILNGHLKQKRKFPYVHHLVSAKQMRNRDIRNKIKDIAPQVVIASTYQDIKAIYTLPYFMKNTNFYYYNLEVYTSYVSPNLKKDNLILYLKKKIEYPCNKIKEIIYTTKTKAFTIQDDLRCRLSAKYHIKHKNTILIPNTYVFDENKITFLRGEGIIYTGGISWCIMEEQFVNLEKVKRVPITFSGWTDHAYDAYIAKFRKTNPNITFVMQQLSAEKYTEYLQQYAVGFVWYSSKRELVDENDYYIGLASGKMFKYLSMGKPVIVMNSKEIANEVRKYKLGIAINNLSELEDAYIKIMANYPYYQRNVIEVYKHKYDFKKVISPLLDCIEMP